MSAARGGPGRVHVIGGRLRGSKLLVPERPGLRPTPGRVRETVFNWLQPTIAGARALDLFAGSGALGIEALSRGAAAVTFVEREADLADALRGNLVRLHQDDATQVVRADAMQWLQTTAQAFDLVFLDPPFALDLWTAAAQRLEQGGWLQPQAWIYVESPAGIEPALPGNWSLHRERRAGDVRFALYRRVPGDPLS